MTGEVSWRIVSLEDPDGWSEALGGLRHAIAHTWGYNAAMQETSEVPIELFVCSSEDARFVCPLSLRDHQGATDLYTPSGFAGPVGRGDIAVFREAWSEFIDVREVVAGYVGLHPRLSPAPLRHDRAAVSDHDAHLIDLDRSPEAVWRGMSENPRRVLRRLRADGDALELDRAILTPAFVRLFEPFMRRKGATRTYALSQATLKGLCDLDDVLVVGHPRSQPEAVALFGATEHGAEYLYGVATPEARQHLLVLIWFALERFMERGVPWLNLGGATVPSLAEFKRRLGAERYPIVALKQIYRPDVYERLCRSAGVGTDSKGYFPAYRSV